MPNLIFLSFNLDRSVLVLIKSAFLETRNISAVSRKLGVSRTTIYKHLN
jgi:transcriptional regulator of acetoin/glycerol metabolism